jgi:hypothetical protein
MVCHPDKTSSMPRLTTQVSQLESAFAQNHESVGSNVVKLSTEGQKARRQQV